MITKKITLNEFRSIVKQIIKESLTPKYNKTWENFKNWFRTSNNFTDDKDMSVNVNDYKLEMGGVTFILKGNIDIMRNLSGYEEDNRAKMLRGVFTIDGVIDDIHFKNLTSGYYTKLTNDNNGIKSLFTQIYNKNKINSFDYNKDNKYIIIHWLPSNNTNLISNDMAFEYYKKYYLPNIESINSSEIEDEFKNQIDFLNRQRSSDKGFLGSFQSYK